MNHENLRPFNTMPPEEQDSWSGPTAIRSCSLSVKPIYADNV